MEWKYPYVKRPLKPCEINATLYFVNTILLSGVIIFIALKHTQIPQWILATIIISLCIYLAIDFLNKGYSECKKGGI